MSEAIFELSQTGRKANTQIINLKSTKININNKYLRTNKPLMPEVSELEVIRHYTTLSQENFSVDTNFYPLGSCTMKYNPHCLHTLASLPEFLNRHPYALPENSQGFLQCMHEMQTMLKEIVGMPGMSLAPMAGAQGEFAGVSMIRAYHLSRKDTKRTEIIVPDAAHGTNPASATMAGFNVVEVKTKPDGDVDLKELKKKIGPQTAGIMLTNPSTLGVFERQITKISKMIHDVGGLLYYDGANLNAILGKARPGDMGFDVLHLNLHKTFGTPHGGGGPGSGPVACCKKLIPFLPIPVIKKSAKQYIISSTGDHHKTIGHLSAFCGNAGIMLRAYIYLRLLGAKGLDRVGEFATLNSNYLMQKLSDAGFEVPFIERKASHEFIVSLRKETKQYHITAMDVAKRLLDYGKHAPTVYFPLLIPECLLIEPTETESKQEIDKFVEVMTKIMHEIKKVPEMLRSAPHATKLRRLDTVKAAKEPNLVWKKQ
ncbi:MAG: aminomethyl-transferring glycine dehydrogenase subunit GcvPB [Gammaproteobacteria bacterium]|nr:aminomethyl-transferring glycine dehydrogenase subunit GcvPB [Gammaproteobacteria bacterium]